MGHSLTGWVTMNMPPKNNVHKKFLSMSGTGCTDTKRVRLHNRILTLKLVKWVALAILLSRNYDYV